MSTQSPGSGWKEVEVQDSHNRGQQDQKVQLFSTVKKSIVIFTTLVIDFK